MTKCYHDYHKPSKARERKVRNARKGLAYWKTARQNEDRLRLWFMRFMGMSNA